MTETTLTKIFSGVAVIALILAAFGTGMYYSGWKAERGDIGPQGNMGPTGPVGEIGDTGIEGSQGEKGEPGVNGTDGEDGARGSRGYTGEKGDTGEQGLTGEDGIDGIDLEPNEAPTIDVNTSESYIEGCEWSDDYHYYLNITLEDIELDLMKVYLYTRWSETSNWDYISAWPMTTNGTYLNYHKESSGNGDWGNRTLYWLVEVMDGENLVYNSGFTTLEKLYCP